MKTQKVKSPQHGQTPFYGQDGWLVLTPVKVVTICNAVTEYDKAEGKWRISDQNGKHLGSLWRNNDHLTILLTDEWEDKLEV